MAYNFKHVYSYIQALFKHKIKIMRASVVEDVDGISSESLVLVAENVDAYVTQNVDVNNFVQDDTMEVKARFNVHVKYNVDLQSGDYVEARIPSNEGHIILKGYVSHVRIGTATRRALCVLVGEKEQGR